LIQKIRVNYLKIMTDIDGKTQLVGLLGWPVSHSFSPAMHNAAAEALGLNWVYVPLPVRVQELQEALAGLPSLGFRGVNVTVPHKQNVMPLLDEVEAGARLIGAVNTITINRRASAAEHRWLLSGTNTDWVGFLTDLEANEVQVGRRDCLVLGAGGSARAVVYALLQAGARVHLLARRPDQAQQLAYDFRHAGNVHSGSLADLPEYISDLLAPLIVNSTPLGMTPQVDQSVWPADLPFPKDAFIYDLVYNPKQTLFMRQALAGGCRASNGLGMLVYQGALAFEIWTGKIPDIQVMRSALASSLV
jgi:shikimate dehydrogenase